MIAVPKIMCSISHAMHILEFPGDRVGSSLAVPPSISSSPRLVSRQPPSPAPTPPARARAKPSTTPPTRASPTPPSISYNVYGVGKTRKDSMGILNLIGNATEREVKKIIEKLHEYTIQINIVQIQPACHQTKRRNILNWLTTCTYFYARMCDG